MYLRIGVSGESKQPSTRKAQNIPLIKKNIGQISASVGASDFPAKVAGKFRYAGRKTALPGV